MSYNKVILIGNLTRDPEIKLIVSTAICNFSLALNRKFKSGEEQKEEVSYFDVVVFGKQAETVTQYMKKGSLVLVEGRLKQERWDDKETGKGRSKVVIVADQVRFLPNAKDSNTGEGEKTPSEQDQNELGGYNVPF